MQITGVVLKVRLVIDHIYASFTQVVCLKPDRLFAAVDVEHGGIQILYRSASAILPLPFEEQGAAVEPSTVHCDELIIRLPVIFDYWPADLVNLV